MNFDIYEQKRKHEETKKFYTENERPVTFEGISINVKINENDFDELFKKVLLEDEDYVP